MLYFFINKSLEETKTSHDFILEISIVCVATDRRILRFHTIELHCHPEIIKQIRELYCCTA